MLEGVRREQPFQLEEVDIATSTELEAAFRERIPVVAIDGDEAFWFRVDPAALRRRLTQSD